MRSDAAARASTRQLHIAKRVALVAPLPLLALVSGCTAPAPAQSPEPMADTVAIENFALPFEVVAPPELENVPTETFLERGLNWLDGDIGIRAVIPVSVLQDGGPPTTDLPDDYAGYIRSIASLTFSDETTIEVDGTAAEVMTIAPQPGSYKTGEMGCAREVTDAEAGGSPEDIDGCFGFPDDLVYRFAVIDRGPETLLIWARVPGPDQDAEFFGHFDEMLTTLRFV